MGVKEDLGSAPRDLSDVDAVIFVHGISPHQPMASLESLIREYERHASEVPSSASWDLRYHQTADGRRPTPFYIVVEPGAKERHFFEALWSPLAKYKVPVHRVAAWILTSSFSPRRFRSTDSPAGKQSADAVTLLALGVAVAACALAAGFFAGLLLAAAALAWAAPNAVETIGAFACLAIAIGYGFVNRAAMSLRSTWHTPVRIPAIVSIVALVGLIGATIWAIAEDLIRYDPRAPVLLLYAGVILLGLAGFAVGLRYLVDAYLADIYIATRTDVNDPTFQVREQVTEHVADLIGSVLVAERRGGPRSYRYRKIVILGHSLGSVIALDAIGRLNERYLAAEGAEDDFSEPDRRSDAERFPLVRLTALMTYGSPLAKVGLLRRALVPAQTEYARYLGEQTTEIFARTGTPGALWTNFWCMGDPISDPLGNASWLAASGTIFDVELVGGKYFASHGKYVEREEFWRCQGRGVLDILR